MQSRPHTTTTMSKSDRSHHKQRARTCSACKFPGVAPSVPHSPHRSVAFPSLSLLFIMHAPISSFNLPHLGWCCTSTTVLSYRIRLIKRVTTVASIGVWPTVGASNCTPVDRPNNRPKYRPTVPRAYLHYSLPYPTKTMKTKGKRRSGKHVRSFHSDSATLEHT